MSGSAGPPRVKLGRTARKQLLLLHVVAVAMWFGIDIALGVLVLTAMLTTDPGTAGTALQAADVFAVWPMFGASLVSLATGVALGLGTRYGLLRYWWVAIKLGVNILTSFLLVFALRPLLGEADGIGQRLAAGDPTASVPTALLGPVVVAPALLLLSFALGVFKPRARIGGGPESGREAPAMARAR